MTIYYLEIATFRLPGLLPRHAFAQLPQSRWLPTAWECSFNRELPLVNSPVCPTLNKLLTLHTLPHHCGANATGLSHRSHGRDRCREARYGPSVRLPLEDRRLERRADCHGRSAPSAPQGRFPHRSVDACPVHAILSRQSRAQRMTTVLKMPKLDH